MFYLCFLRAGKLYPYRLQRRVPPVTRLNLRVAEALATAERLGMGDARLLSADVTLDAEVRRQTILGGIVCEHFPEFRYLQPKSTELENQKEFAPAKIFMERLAADEYAEKLLKQAFDNPTVHTPPILTAENVPP